MDIVDAENKDQKDVPSVDAADHRDQQDVPSKDKDSPPSQDGGDKLYTKAELDEFVNKRHAKLDAQLSNLTKEFADLKQKNETLQGQIDEGKKSTLEAQKQKELDEAGGDATKIKQINAKYAAVSEHEDLTLENDRLKAEIESNKDVLERMNEQGKKDHAKALQESTGVSADLILTLFSAQKLTQIEEMDAIAEQLKDHVKGGDVKLPHPDRIVTTPKAPLEGKSPQELAELAYADNEKKRKK